ncbi:MAG: protein-methionine-sulfoxide reductase catalytic subunit MsrP [Gammaproteobacteria bacterium]|nr:protein-methionine-sulfoxide reductase catalytic subunit MsrP [Gammaproteobacteria bacterium]
MIIRRTADLTDNDVTDPALYHDRRRFIRSGFALAAGALVPGLDAAAAALDGDKFVDLESSSHSTDEELTSHQAITTYNNFYEFGLGKEDPARYADSLRTRPREVAVEGECHKPTTFDIEDILADFDMQERIYRLRCVEAWSMVVPWVGFELGAFIKRVEPTMNAKYVEFLTLHDPEQMPNQRRGLFGTVLDWPYREGLRMDEAMHPLTILATGLYGEVLPKQNGAPIRLVVPLEIRLQEHQVHRFHPSRRGAAAQHRQQQAPREYGFYANVNPEVDHPRWSQARERRIGELLRRDTLPFNGYAEEVASLYNGMDPKTLY